MKLSNVVIALGGALWVGGFALSFHSVDLAMNPERCAAPVSDPRTAGELWKAIRGSAEPQDEVDLAILEITAMQDARSIGARTEISRFFQAAYLAEGWVDSSGHSDLPDTADYGVSASSILARLKAEFPENGIYPYYLAGILKETGAGKETVMREFKTAFDSPRMDAHAESITRRIMRESLRDPAAFTAGRALIAQLRLPNPVKSFFALRAILEEDASAKELAQSVEKWAHARLAEGKKRLKEWEAFRSFGLERVFGEPGDLRMARTLLISASVTLGKPVSRELRAEFDEKSGRFPLSARLAALKGCESLRSWEYQRAKQDLPTLLENLSHGALEKTSQE